jgi:N-succinyldiaminopimelate aminotransferase
MPWRVPLFTPSARVQSLSDYPFDRLRALLADLSPAASLEPLMLSVGEPRHPPPPLVARVLSEHAGDWNRYPPVEGTAPFREAVVRWLDRRYGLPTGFLDPDRHVLPAAGTREALYLVAQVAVEQGRSPVPVVLIPNPFYQVYVGAAVMQGAEPVFLPATRETGFLPDLGALSSALLDRTALFYLCSPGNPQGAVAPIALLQAAIELARRYGFLLAVDECYAEIYDRSPPPGALEAAARLSDTPANVIVFHSLSKRSSVPGLRSGFVAGDEAVIAAFRRLRAFAGATVPLPVLAASAALWSDEDHVEANRALYRAKFDRAERRLAGRFGFYRPAGGFFLWLDVADGEAAARRLWHQQAVRTLPGAYLARDGGVRGNPGHPYIRIAMIDDLSRTEEALSRIALVL